MFKYKHRKSVSKLVTEKIAQVTGERGKGNNCLKKSQIKCQRHSQDPGTEW